HPRAIMNPGCCAGNSQVEDKSFRPRREDWSALRRSAKVTMVLPLQGGAQRSLARFFGYENVERICSSSIHDFNIQPQYKGISAMNKVENQQSPQVANPSPTPRTLARRAFLGRMALGAALLTPGAALLADSKGKGKGKGKGHGHGNENGITQGDAALLRFAAAAEILETDFWVQYNVLGGIQDSEEPDGSGNLAYTNALKFLDGDMDQYIHD